MRKYIFALSIVLSVTALARSQDNGMSNRVKIDPDQTYLVLSTKKIGTMEKELDEVAAKGFRVMYGAPTQQYDMALLLKRSEGDPGSHYSYKILATSRQKTMEKELNDAAKLGYRLLPRTIIFKQGFFTGELVMAMEREPDSKRSFEYDLVSAGKESSLHKKIDASISLGFQPLTMVTIGEHIIVMEREITTR